LIRALYDWISDNDLTPYVLVDARAEGVRVPPFAVKEGQVVLNLAMRAVENLELGNDLIRFRARFSGHSHDILVPIAAVRAIYAQENGQGMMFPPDAAQNAEQGSEPPSGEPEGPKPAQGPKKGPKLRVVK